MEEPIPLYTLYFTVKYVEKGEVKSHRCNVELPLKAARHLWDILDEDLNFTMSQKRP